MSNIIKSTDRLLELPVERRRYPGTDIRRHEPGIAVDHDDADVVAVEGLGDQVSCLRVYPHLLWFPLEINRDRGILTF